MDSHIPHFLRELFNTFRHKAQNVAFVIDGEKFTYESLESKTYQIASIIQSEIETERIGIFVSNNIETYASILACWCTGHSFVPLDASAPIERNLGIIKEADLNSVLCKSLIRKEKYKTHVRLINITNNREVSYCLSEMVDRTESWREAYVLFTSGSTGKPKGVPISIDNLQSFLDSFRTTEFMVSESDRCLQMFELTFDVSISSFLPALLSGAEIYTAGGQGAKYVEVLRLINEYKLTSIQIVPSVVRLGKSLIKRVDLSSVKQCILTGEATDVNTFKVISGLYPKIEFFNFYGPTECTIYCTYCRLSVVEAESYRGIMSIGRPMKGVTISIGEIEGRNHSGELYLEGNQLSSGYLDGAMDEGSFEVIPRGVLYKTGDIVQMGADGNLYYLGRKDRQVHRQGHRIELGEISYVINDRFQINSWPVHVVSNEGIDLIVLVLEEGVKDVFSDVVSEVNAVLPAYMRPNSIYFTKEVPLTASGKADLNKLKEFILAS